MDTRPLNQCLPGGALGCGSWGSGAILSLRRPLVRAPRCHQCCEASPASRLGDRPLVLALVLPDYERQGLGFDEGELRLEKFQELAGDRIVLLM